MKKESRGFALVETLIVSTIIASILIYMFVQFNKIDENYNESFRYNDVDDLYKLDSIKDYINSLPNVDKSSIITAITNDSLIIIDKDNNTYNNIEYIDDQESLLDDLDIKMLVITNSDINNVDTSDLSPNIKRMLKKINNKSDNYRFIVEFNNDNIATITFDMEVS